MNRRSYLRLVNEFSEDNPRELSRQLAQLEANVSSAFAQLGSTFPLHLQVRQIATGNCAVLPWDMLPVDSAGASLSVTLPPPSQAIAGSWVVLLRRSTANTVTIRPTTGSVNGTTTVALAASKKAFPFFCDGTGWWAV